MFDLLIIPDNKDIQPFEVSAGMRDLRLWEKTFPKRSMGMMTDRANMSATALFEIAFVACRRAGLLTGQNSVDEFAAAYDFELADDKDDESDDDDAEGDDPENPTQSAA